MSTTDNWSLQTIDDLCVRVTSGGTPNRSNPDFYSPAEIPWVKTGDLTDSYIHEYDERISEAGVRGSSAKILPPDTVLMAMYGATVGMLGILSEQATCNQAACAMVAHPDKCDPRWLFYSLLNDREFIISQATGAAQQNLSGKTIRQFQYLTPPLSEQKAIAEVLGALDDKIAANTKLSETIDASLRLQYQHAMQKPEPAPRPLLEVFAVTFGEAFKGENFSEPGSGRPLIRIRDLKTYTSQVWTTESRTKETLVTPGDILVGMDAEFRPTTWLGEPGMLNQRVCRVKSKFGGPAFVREALRKPLDTIENYKTGTTVIHLNKKDLEDNSINIPEADALRAFNESTESLYATRVALAKESRILSATRDVLLPQLISGKLKIRQAEEIVASAV